MPRTSKGPRLWKRPARRKNGRIVAASVWIIKDGGKHIATGCLAEPSGKRPPAKAERALAGIYAGFLDALFLQIGVIVAPVIAIAFLINLRNSR